MQMKQPGYHGFTISFTAAFREEGGVDLSYPTVQDVLPGTPAAAAGLASGDVILEVNGVDSRRGGSLYPTEGERYAMRIQRDDETLDVAFVPEPKRPPRGT